MYSLRMYCVVIMELCERFSFSCLRSVLSFYLRDVLLYDERQTVDIYHVFVTLCYVSAIIGGIVANSDYGKYKSIVSFSIVYWIGVLILFWSTVEMLNTWTNFMVLYSLILIAIGMGSIKPCLAVFGVDQFTENNKNSKNLRLFFNSFYLYKQLGIVLGLLASPVIINILSYKGLYVNTYTITYGLPVILMTTAISIFVCGSPYYLFKKPVPNILPTMIKYIFFILLRQLRSCYKKTNGNQWLKYANDAPTEYIVNDTKKTLYMLRLYVPLSIFLSLFDQQNTTWIFQASRTNDRMFGMKFPVCYLQVVNPLLVVFTIPFMNRIVYPYLERHKLFKYPLKRMLLAGSLAGTAFIFAGCIEMYIEANSQNVNVTEANRCVMYAKPYSAYVWSSNLDLQKSNQNEYFIVNNVNDTTNGTCTKIRIARSYRKSDDETIGVRLERNGTPITLLMVVTETEHNPYNASLLDSSTVLVPEKENARTTSEQSICLISPKNDGDMWPRIENLTLESTLTGRKTTVYEKNRFRKPGILDIPPGLYTLTINYANKTRRPRSRTVFSPKTDNVYTYTRPRHDETNTAAQSPDTVRRVLNKEWLLPQIVFMSFGESLFTVTGLAFSFSESPDTIKSVSLSMWYFSVALGNGIVIFVNKFTTFEKQSCMFFVFALNALLAIVVTYRLSNEFEKLYGDRKKRSSDTENVGPGDLPIANLSRDDVDKNETR